MKKFLAFSNSNFMKKYTIPYSYTKYTKYTIMNLITIVLLRLYGTAYLANFII